MAIGAAVLAFAQRSAFGRCCVCGRKRVPSRVIPHEGINLRVCDHRCAFKLGGLIADAYRKGDTTECRTLPLGGSSTTPT